MWTFRYKTAWIHGYTHTAACRIQWTDFTFTPAKSLRAAKIKITRKL